MKKIILMVICCLALIAFVSIGFADDLVCDPNPDADQYRILGLDPARTIQSAELDGSVKYDVGILGPGAYAGTIEAGAAYVLNGTEQPAIKWSAAVPFDLIVPGTPANSSGLGIEL